MKMTKKALLAKLEDLGPLDEKARNKTVCALIGHSRIQEYCWGYFYCSRCGAQLGDNLGGSYENASKVVIVGHDCPTCRDNYKDLTWRDKLFCPDPFTKEEKADASEDTGN